MALFLVSRNERPEKSYNMLIQKKCGKTLFLMSILRYNLYLTLYNSSVFMTRIFAYNKDGFWSLSYFGKDNS